MKISYQGWFLKTNEIPFIKRDPSSMFQDFSLLIYIS